MVELNYNRLINTMEEQAQIGSTGREGEINRLAPSDELKEVYDWFISILEKEGLSVRIDEIGNVFARREGEDPDKAPVLVGSHLDSHPHGGTFDGALGVVAAIELVRTLNEENIRTKHPIEVVNWFKEESGRFGSGKVGSRVWAGLLDIEKAYQKKDSNDTTLKNELERIGYIGDTAASPQNSYKSYYELHIEQAGNLKQHEKDVGIVTGTIGATRGIVTLTGQTNHSGGTRMFQREDALVAAADIILQVKRIANSVGERTVGTVGNISIEPNNRNAIPGEAKLTWEFRDPEEKNIEAALQRLLDEIELTAKRQNVSWTAEEVDRYQGVRFDATCIETIRKSVEVLGYDVMNIFSGGGHDAQIITNVCDAGMIFAVNDSGRSHTAEEWTSWENCYKGANTLATAVLNEAEKLD